MARMTSVAISYLKNSLPSPKNQSCSSNPMAELCIFQHFRLCFSTVTLNSSTSPRELWQTRPVIPLWCCQILPHSISFGPLPPGGCLSLYPPSHQPLAPIWEKCNQRHAPGHTWIPWKLGSDSRSLLLVALQWHLPASHSQPFSFPLSPACLEESCSFQTTLQTTHKPPPLTGVLILGWI